MTKSLTELWKDGELELNSLWFVRLPCGLYDECFYTGSTIFMKSISGHDEKIWQVIAPVPNYEEFQRLQEQLNEANAIITGEVHLVKRKDDTYVCECPEIVNYKEKWGVK